MRFNIDPNGQEVSWKMHTRVQFLHVVSGDFGAFGDSKRGLQFGNFAAVRAFGDVIMAPLPYSPTQRSNNSLPTFPFFLDIGKGKTDKFSDST